jgi:hypothetical protein
MALGVFKISVNNNDNFFRRLRCRNSKWSSGTSLKFEKIKYKSFKKFL